MGDAMTAQTVMIAGHGGDQIEAYLARPFEDHPRGGVVVIHHMPGYDRATKEMTRRFAELGYHAICPNLHYREAPGASPDDASAAARAQGGVPDERLVGDVDGALRYLRDLPQASGKVGVIGHCSGGRQAVLSACTLPLDAAVDCYGAFVLSDSPAEYRLRATSLESTLPQLDCPLLGLFGADDKNPAPDEVQRLERLLAEHGKEFEIHSYGGAGHGFFAVDRPSYRVEAANDGWEQIALFFDKHLS